KLSIRYINDRFLPDKAIDLIDEAASRAKLKTFTEPTILKTLEDNIQKISAEKEEAIQVQDFEKAAKLRDTERKEKEKLEKKKQEIQVQEKEKEKKIKEKKRKEKEKLEKEKQKWKDKTSKNIKQIGEEDIAEVISNWTGIPAKKISQDENERLKNLENALHE